MARLAPLVAALAATTALGAVSVVKADTVIMRNGDRLSGKVLHMSADTVTLQTSYIGTLKLPRGQVASVSTNEPATLLLKNNAAAQKGRLARASPGHAVLQLESARKPPRTIPLANIKFLNPTPAESGSGIEYNGHVTLSATRVQGNSTGSTLNIQAGLRARAKTFRYAVRGSVNQASLGGKTVTSNWLVSTHLDQFVVDSKHFRYVRASAQRDRFRDLRLRATLGAGYGWQLIANAGTSLSVGGGLDLVAVDRYANPNQRYPALGWTLHISHWLWQHRVDAFHTEAGYWDLSHSRDVTVRTRTGLRVPIAEGLLANAELDVDWDRHPPPGVKPTDSTLLLGLGYQW